MSIALVTTSKEEKLFSPPGESRHLSTIPIIKRHVARERENILDFFLICWLCDY